MKWVTTLIAMVLAVTILTYPITAQEKPSLFKYLSSAELKVFVFSTEQNATLKAIRADPAATNLRVGRASLDAVQEAQAMSILLPTPPGIEEELTASFDSLNFEQRTDRDYSLYAQGTTPETEVSLVVLGLDVSGTIKHNGNVYKVHPLGAGITAVYLYNINQLQDHPKNYRDFIKKQSHFLVPKGPVPNLPTTMSSDLVIDVLVAYTARARNEAGNINGLVQLAFDETKRIYANSRIKPRLRLVHKYLTSYQESGDMETDLSRLRSSNDGYIDEIHARRNLYKADLVVLLVGRNEYCGVGYQYANQSWAFSVVGQNCATSYYSFAHELGHNQGAHHDPDTDSNKNFAYGHGFCNSPDNWRTVMSYNSGSSCRNRLQYFSNPRVSHMGALTGDASLRNNARVINETAYRVANFRALNCTGWKDDRNIPGKTGTFYNLASSMDIVRCLNEGNDLEARDKRGATPLHKAVLNNNAEAVKALLDAGARLESKYAEASQSTALHLAAEVGFTKIVTILLSGGANLESQDEFKDSPLHRAAYAARRRGTDHKSVTARSHAVANIKALIAAGAKLETRNKNGITPLHRLVKNSENVVNGALDNIDETRVVGEAIRTLIVAGANLEAQDKDEGTPLHLAATNNVYDQAVSIIALIEAGANLSAEDALGKTPLHRASEFNAHKHRPVEICEPKFPNPAQPNCSTKTRRAHGVHIRNATAAIHALLNAGADATARTKEGKTAFELVEDGSPIKNTEAYRRLKEAQFGKP
ncbi:MAG: ankyrin repeat domain-containing protein [Nitrospinae bacterium]|nr:ankyrin repeat domain-containing protein [Nitrospinota bacterium]